MRFLVAPILLLAALFPVRAQTTSAPPATTESEAQIRAIVDSEADAWNHGDAQAFGAHYAEDGSFTNVIGQQLYGRQAFIAQHAGIFSTIYKGSHCVFTIGKIKFRDCYENCHRKIKNTYTEAQMDCAISGRVTEFETGTTLTSPRLALHRIGVIGETATALDEDGRFSFASLCAGEYLLSAYSNDFVYWHQSLTLSEGQTVDNLQVTLVRGGRIVGQLLDEKGRPPQQGLMTLLRPGERNGRSGLISVSGDHQAGKDGRFQSPPLSDGSYILRFAGILQKPANAEIPSQERGLRPDRIFDFLYPNAHDVTYASAVVVERAQTVDLQVRIPRPIRYRVRGCVQGELPEDRQYISLQFTRELGTLDPVGWAGGAAIQSDGSFEGLEQPGNYRAEICQFAPPEPSGRTHLVRSFGSANFRLDSEDISDVKIQVGSDL